MFKFVLTRDKTLYIGFETDYHAQICNDASRFDVVGAGYLKVIGGAWLSYGNSIGYDVSFNHRQEALIQQLLKDVSEESVIEAIEMSYDDNMVSTSFKFDSWDI